MKEILDITINVLKTAIRDTTVNKKICTKIDSMSSYDILLEIYDGNKDYIDYSKGKTIYDYNMSIRLQKVMEHAGLKDFSDIERMSLNELKGIKDMNMKCFDELQDILNYRRNIVKENYVCLLLKQGNVERKLCYDADTLDYDSLKRILKRIICN